MPDWLPNRFAALCGHTGFSLQDLSCLACGTSSPDQLIPNHASMVQAELGCGPCDLASLSGVCCSGMAAFKYGYLHVLHGQGSNAIVCGSELASPSLTAKHFETQLSAKRKQHESCDFEKKPTIAFRNEFLRWMLSDGAGAALIRSKPAEAGWNLRIDWIDLLSYAHQSEPCMYAGMVKCDDGSYADTVIRTIPGVFPRRDAQSVSRRGYPAGSLAQTDGGRDCVGQAQAGTGCGRH